MVAMEISSHALDQGRVHGIPLRNAGWTNFSQDHLDYHGDEASYFAAKARILDLIQAGGRLFCSSPEVADRLRERGEPRVPIEVLAPAALGPEAIAAKPFLALEHNRANYALAAALADGVLGPGARPYWRDLHPVDGRFECQSIGNRTLVIDFAHTPDALETILDRHPRRLPRGQGRDPVRLRRGSRSRQAPPHGCGGGAPLRSHHRDLGQPPHRGPRAHHRGHPDRHTGPGPGGGGGSPRGHRPPLRPAGQPPARTSPGWP